MRFSKVFITIIFLTTAFFACKKDPDSITLTPNFYIINGDPADSAETLILFSSSDEITYNLVISSTYFVSPPVLVTVGVSDESRTAFNSTYNTNYQAMPAGSFSFKDTITTSTYSPYDTITVSIYKHALSADVQYMLPIKIINAGGYNIDATNSVIYLHTSNNIFAGIYNSAGTKIMYNGADSSKNDTSTFSLVKNLIPFTDKSCQADYADLGVNGWQYIIGISPEDSLFYVAPNNVILNSIQTGSFKVLEKSFDSTTKNIYIKSSYKNLSGDERIVEESLTLQ